MTELNLLHYNKGTLVNMIKKLEEENEYFKIQNKDLKLRIDNLEFVVNMKQYAMDKVVELISKEFLCYDNESDEYIQGKKAINILTGGDEE